MASEARALARIGLAYFPEWSSVASDQSTLWQTYTDKGNVSGEHAQVERYTRLIDCVHSLQRSRLDIFPFL
jgi:hypothetical protein